MSREDKPRKAKLTEVLPKAEPGSKKRRASRKRLESDGETACVSLAHSSLPTSVGGELAPQIGDLARNFFQAIGEPLPCGSGHVAESFDWKAHGVSVPYLMFITGRCGSTWLTSLLGATEIVGWPDEFFNADISVKWASEASPGFVGYLEQCVAKTQRDGRFGAQLEAVQILELRNFIRLPGIFPPDRAKTFFIFRNDIIAQAWSWVSARKSGVWHSLGASAPQEGGCISHDGPSEEELSREIIRIRECEEFLEGYFHANGYQPVYVSYEGLVSNTAGTIATILTRLGAAPAEVESACRSLQSDVNRLRYEDRDLRLATYENRHRVVFEQIRRSRFGVSSVAIRQALLGW